jgi:hypothetical protein
MNDQSQNLGNTSVGQDVGGGNDSRMRNQTDSSPGNMQTVGNYDLKTDYTDDDWQRLPEDQRNAFRKQYPDHRLSRSGNIQSGSSPGGISR